MISVSCCICSTKSCMLVFIRLLPRWLHRPNSLVLYYTKEGTPQCAPSFLCTKRVHHSLRHPLSFCLLRFQKIGDQRDNVLFPFLQKGIECSFVFIEKEFHGKVLTEERESQLAVKCHEYKGEGYFLKVSAFHFFFKKFSDVFQILIEV